jgi:uncharacterized membrane protein YgdD (TMEM256/DUF423 family)
MKRIWWYIVGVSGSVAVTFGALGAHTLERVVSEKQLEVWKTATQYQVIHTLLLLAMLVFSTLRSDVKFKVSSIVILLGILFFSGSLYLLSCRDLLFLPKAFVKVLGPITPVGGLLLLSGWLIMAFEANKILKQ